MNPTHEYECPNCHNDVVVPDNEDKAVTCHHCDAALAVNRDAETVGGIWRDLTSLSVAPVSDFYVLAAMVKYGGSFAQALAQAARLADDNNLARIKAGWPDYWAKYTEMARIKPQANP